MPGPRLQGTQRHTWHWLRDSAPAGIRVPLDELEGIMPRVEKDEPPECHDLLATEYDTWSTMDHLKRTQWL